MNEITACKKCLANRPWSTMDCAECGHSVIVNALVPNGTLMVTVGHATLTCSKCLGTVPVDSGTEPLVCQECANAMVEPIPGAQFHGDVEAAIKAPIGCLFVTVGEECYCRCALCLGTMVHVGKPGDGKGWECFECGHSLAFSYKDEDEGQMAIDVTLDVPEGVLFVTAGDPI